MVMMKPMGSYNIAHAKTHLSEILERVAAGEEVLLTRRGKPVARVVPAAQPSASILGAGAGDPTSIPGCSPGDDWWKPLPEDEAQPWYE